MEFFYTSREPIAPKAGDTEVTFYNYTHSFNTNCVVRTVEYAPGKIMVLLNDGHEEAIDKTVEKKNGAGKVIGQEHKRERVWMVSEVQLNEEDTKRYWIMQGKPTV